MPTSLQKPFPFILNNQDNKSIALEDFKGKWLVLYFYPKDNTPGCTTEACDFSECVPQNVEIVGISPDLPETHQKFVKKYALKLTLLSDPTKEVMKKYGAWGLKKNFGWEYEGVIRSTFIITPDGEIAHSWHNVKAKGHAERVIEKLKAIKPY